MKSDYEPGMKVIYDGKSQRVVVTFRGRITVLPATYADEADALRAGERYCREHGWTPLHLKAGSVRHAWG